MLDSRPVYVGEVQGPGSAPRGSSWILVTPTEPSGGGDFRMRLAAPLNAEPPKQPRTPVPTMHSATLQRRTKAETKAICFYCPPN